MSNQVFIEPTKFVNLRTGEETLGYRMYDAYGKTYNNVEDYLPAGNIELLKMILEEDYHEDEVIRDMVTSIVEEEKGINIGGDFLSWEEIKETVLEVHKKYN